MCVCYFYEVLLYKTGRICLKEAYLRSLISQKETLNPDFSQQEGKSISEILAPPDMMGMKYKNTYKK